MAHTGLDYSELRHYWDALSTTRRREQSTSFLTDRVTELERSNELLRDDLAMQRQLFVSAEAIRGDTQQARADEFSFVYASVALPDGVNPPSLRSCGVAVAGCGAFFCGSLGPKTCVGLVKKCVVQQE